jgi:hypothetical protein
VSILSDDCLLRRFRATVGPSELKKPDVLFLSKFNTVCAVVQNEPSEVGLEGSVQRDTMGVKKDTSLVLKAIEDSWSSPFVLPILVCANVGGSYASPILAGRAQERAGLPNTPPPG